MMRGVQFYFACILRCIASEKTALCWSAVEAVEINRGFFNLLCNRSAVDFNRGWFQPQLRLISMFCRRYVCCLLGCPTAACGTTPGYCMAQHITVYFPNPSRKCLHPGVAVLLYLTGKRKSETVSTQPVNSRSFFNLPWTRSHVRTETFFNSSITQWKENQQGG